MTHQSGIHLISAAQLSNEVGPPHFGVYGVRKVWRALNREGLTVAR